MKTVITACFEQETNRYAPGLTTMEDFCCRNAGIGEACRPPAGSKVRSGWNSFYSYFADKPDYRLVPVADFEASPGPVVAQDVWDLIMDQLLKAINEEPKVDGILLALHGAMVTEKYEDAEGEMLERLRNAVGQDIPIMSSLDLHVNMTQKMIDNADALFPYDYYPHTDSFETGIRAAKCMYEALEGKIRPVMAWRKLDYIMQYTPTTDPYLSRILACAQSWRGKDGIINAGICHGFFPADIYEQGVAVAVVADENLDLAQKVADDLGQRIFDARKQMERHFLTAEEGVKIAMESDAYPVVIADVADNPGAGASADATTILRELIEKNAQGVAFASIYDPEVVDQARNAGVGSTITVSLGGKTVPEITGGPVVCEAYVKMLTDGQYRNRDEMSQGCVAKLGNTALLQIGGIQVLAVSNHTQSYDLEVYRHVGIQPEDMKILVIKSTIHFRNSFSKVAAKILDVEAPALALQSPLSYPMAHSRRPIYPLDPI